MEFVADLHIHSRFSRATSRDLDLEHLWLSAQRKGVTVVGTGDFTHPAWFAELEAKLEPAEEGLYRLKPEVSSTLSGYVPPACRGEVRFLLTVEISNIYKWEGRTRKVHNLIAVPDLSSAAAFSRALARIGNITSDGRPILGLDSRDLLEILLETATQGVLIPAHIWTPWFSALGSKSGFDSIAACYRDLTPHIFAVETGLSSDPPMNWRLSSLDDYALVSNSDAHSASKLAREANIFSCALSYHDLFGALRHPQHQGFEGTIEFFPEEGKYHFDGHRKCTMRLDPQQSRALNGCCPQCGKPLTLGVLYRVEALADRPAGQRPPRAAAFCSLVGLAQVLGEVLQVGPASRKVERDLERLVQRFGPELRILREVPEEDLRHAHGPVLAEAIGRMRRGVVRIDGGYDGEYGQVFLLEKAEHKQLTGQTGFFAGEPAPVFSAGQKRAASASAVLEHEPEKASRQQIKKRAPGVRSQSILCAARSALSAPRTTVVEDRAPVPIARVTGRDNDAGHAAAVRMELFSRLPDGAIQGLSEVQIRAVTHHGSPVVIVAGPGTGKTRTLTHRIAYRIDSGLAPAQVLAVTFTNKAAAEMSQRLHTLLGNQRAGQIRVCTFHALALEILNGWQQSAGQAPLRVIGDEERKEYLALLLPTQSKRQRARAEKELVRTWQRLEVTFVHDPEADPEAAANAFSLLEAYRTLLQERGEIDLDGLVPEAVQLLAGHPSLLQHWQTQCQMVCIDEYQDINAAQYRLVRLLCDQNSDLCVIGDPDQAIYSFRGADSRYFLHFDRDYPQAVRFTLEHSYRSAGRLLEAAQAMIAHNRDRLDHRTWSDRPGASQITFCQTSTVGAEAEHIVHFIERSIGGTTLFSLDSGRADGTSERLDSAGYTFSDFAVLFRTSAQAEALEEAFTRSGMPYTCATARRPQDVLAPLIVTLREITAPEASPTALAATICRLGPREALRILVEQCCPLEARPQAKAMVEQLAVLLYGLEPAIERWAPVVLGLVAGANEADGLIGQAESVSLLTLHGSKGLEFPVVIIAGCEEGLLPHLFPDEDVAARFAEERRLLYVGLTRAKEQLLLTAATKRALHGTLRSRAPSPFLQEIPSTLLCMTQPATLPRRPKKAQLSLF